jgi:hypothetical protein
MVNTQVPTMLPMTSPVAEVRPRECALVRLRGERGGPGGSVPPVGPAGGDPLVGPGCPGTGGRETEGGDESIIVVSFVFGGRY